MWHVFFAFKNYYLKNAKVIKSIIIVGIVQQKVDIIIIIILYNVCNVLFNSLAEHV